MPSLGGGEWVILLALVVLLVGLFIYALVGITTHPTASGTMKAVWILIILLFPFVGPILWFLIGKNSDTSNAV